MAPSALSADPAPNERLDLQGDPLPDGTIARLGTSRFNHGNTIQGIAYTPDGKALLSLGGDEFVPRVGAPDRPDPAAIGIKGGRHSHLYVLSPDGKHLITADRSSEGIFQIWDLETGRELRRVPIPEPRQYFSLMAVGPDGKTLATALFDQSIVFRDPHTFAELRRVKVPPGYVRHMAFSPDGRLLAGTSERRLPHMRGMMGGGGSPRPAVGRGQARSIRAGVAGHLGRRECDRAPAHRHPGHSSRCSALLTRWKEPRCAVLRRHDPLLRRGIGPRVVSPER